MKMMCLASVKSSAHFEVNVHAPPFCFILKSVSPACLNSHEENQTELLKTQSILKAVERLGETLKDF